MLGIKALSFGSMEFQSDLINLSLVMILDFVRCPWDDLECLESHLQPHRLSMDSRPLS